MLVGVRPSVGQVHFAALRSDIGKCVEDVRQLIGWQILGVVVATVDCLFHSQHACLLFMVNERTQFTKYATFLYPEFDIMISLAEWGIAVA